MAALSDEVKAFIVQSLACYDTPTQAAKAVAEEFKLEVSPQQCECYDPNKRAGRNLTKKWRDLFDHARKKFLEDTTAIPIANRAVRLRMLQRMAQKAEDGRNIQLAAQLIEQAAKESGGAYTNRQKVEVTGADGGPIQSETVAVDEKAIAAAVERIKNEY